MTDDVTEHYDLALPDVGGSADTWGGDLNNNMTLIDEALFALDSDTLKASENLYDLPDKPLARLHLGLGDAAERGVGNTSNDVAPGDDPRITGALQKADNLFSLASAPAARLNLGLTDCATWITGVTADTLAAGNDGRITGALQKTGNLSGLTDPDLARENLGLQALATRATVDNGVWSGAALAVANGGTGATTAAAARSALGVTAANLGLAAFADKTSQDIRDDLTRADIDAALGKSVMRVNAGTGTSSGLVSWGTAAPSGTPDDGQIYLQYDA